MTDQLERLRSQEVGAVCLRNFAIGSADNVVDLNGSPLVKTEVSEYFSMPSAVDWVWHFASPVGRVGHAELPIQTSKARH